MFELKSNEIHKISESQKNFKDAILALEKQILAQNNELNSKELQISNLITQKIVL